MLCGFILKRLEDSTGSIAYVCVCMYVDTKICVLYTHTFLCVCVYIYALFHIYMHICSLYTLLKSTLLQNIHCYTSQRLYPQCSL